MKYLVAIEVGGICDYFYGTVVGQDGVQTTFNESVKHNSFG